LRKEEREESGESQIDVLIQKKREKNQREVERCKEYNPFKNISVTEIMDYVLCLDKLKIQYDEDRLLTDKGYYLSIIKKLNEKFDKYNGGSAVEYFRTFKNKDKLKTEKYIKNLEEYEKRFEREERERNEDELHDTGVEYNGRLLMTDDNYRKDLVSKLRAEVEKKTKRK
jgi:hypothetical protein